MGKALHMFSGTCSHDLYSNPFKDRKCNYLLTTAEGVACLKPPSEFMEEMRVQPQELEIK